MTTPFINLADATDAHWEAVRQYKAQHPRDPAAPVLALLKSLDGCSAEGLPIDPDQHSLQTASRILRDGGDDELIVVGLLHDVGDFIAEKNHGELAATILRPYVSEASVWLMEHHAAFQGFYFWHQFGMDRHTRERWRGHPHYERTARFCHDYDQCSFDPSYDTLPIDAFEPALRRVLARAPRHGDEVVL
jgi:predicted HD phosphohydrolase